MYWICGLKSRVYVSVIDISLIDIYIYIYIYGVGLI